MNLFEAGNLDEASKLLELQWQFRVNRVLAAAHQLGVYPARRR